MMEKGKYLFWFNVIVAPLLGGFAAYWVAASVLGEYSWCIAGEEHCVREWMSALSGWAAAIAAGLTILFLYHDSLKRDLLEWREIVNSAELLRGILAPQVDHLGSGNRLTGSPVAATWIVPCLEKIERAMSDPRNQEFQRASSIAGAKLRTSLRLVEYAKRFATIAAEKGTPVDDNGQYFITMAHEELREFVSELERIRDSAHRPKSYRGL